ncbi:divalent metal cation transporter [Sphingobacterium sp. lm-10]|uniref:NRAMP family divalent metal transporter n=1 Tax=Sphingobacterium sp. lm-10 TaxID=2944904 RepID=UPI00201FF2BD|nr:NRAMP family divalent metal transporter [Sphingobacterium sp. lm-10]MCL7987532.1 divalent metal cation transporter [Sphingobacterium sp. lm-10]
MKKSNWGALLSAAFLMAISAIGPGFLTQTALFTSQLGASFGFVILASIVVDIVAQLNIWRIVVVSGTPAQDIANRLLPGLGYGLAAMVALGGMAFNIGNLAGAGLGLQVLFGLDVTHGAICSAVIAIGIFLYKEASLAMDFFVKILGVMMIFLMLYIAFKSNPPLMEAAVRSLSPQQFSFTALVTIIGGTVGGYITFAGAHRLLDRGIQGVENLPTVDRGAISAIGIASVMRILLFIAALGVVSAGHLIDPSNPPASVFRWAGGEIGYKIFGLVMWAAAITSVIGSAYTSITFIKSFHVRIQTNTRLVTTCFIVISCLLYGFIGNPVQTLVIVGALNGFILPLALAIMLIAAHHTQVVGSYRQPILLTTSGTIIAIIMTYMGIQTLIELLA